MSSTHTSKDFTGDGSDLTWPFTFNFYKTADIKVDITDADGIFKNVTNFTVASLAGSATAYTGGTVTFNNSTTPDSDVCESTGAPKNTRKIRIYRQTTVSSGTAGAASPNVDYAAGSVLREVDLDNSNKQLLYAAYEQQEQEIVSKKIRDGAITSAKILDGTIVNADINASAEIAVSKLADGAARQLLQTDSGGTGVEWTSNVDVPGTLDVTGAATFDGSVTATTFTGNVSGSSGSTTGNAATATTATKATNITVADESTDTSCNVVFVTAATGDLPPKTGTNLTFNSNTGQLTATKFSGPLTGDVTGNADTATDLAAAAKITNSEQSSHTANDTTYYTTSASDARYYNLASSEEIQSGETWDAADNKVATTKAIDNRVVDLIDDVGGFVALANEAAIPQYHPEKENATTADRVGTIISIGVLSATYTPSGGTCTIPAGTLTNHAVNATITDCGSTTLSSGFGVLVETTAQTDAQYAAGPAFKFHRLTPKATEVTTVAGKATEITTCHTNITNINTVAGNNTNINTVAAANSNITTVAGNNSNISTVATNITDVSNFADLYQISTSAPSTDGGGNSLAVGDLWFDSSSNKALKVHNGTSFQAVSPTQAVLDDIAIVSGDLTRQEDLGNVSDALASATTTSDLETCADNITNINTFANVYRIAASAPSTSLDEGDLWYDSTGNVLKYYNGSSWTVTAAAGLSEISEDTSPELGGHLDCNNKNFTEVGTVSGDNLQIDFGTIA